VSTQAENNNQPIYALKGKYRQWTLPLLASLCLLPLSQVNMTLFHTLTELFAIGIAIMSFVVAWNTFQFSRNRVLLFLGCGYFWIGIIDLMHTLSFENVMIIQDISGGATIQFWIIARYFEAFILLTAPLALTRKPNPHVLFIFLGMLSAVAIALVFNEQLPKMYTPEEGLTHVKIINEYIIISILALAALVFIGKGKQIDKGTKNLLLISIALTICAELCFTLYTGLNERPIIFGHILKLLSFWAIYFALIESSLLKPFQSLKQVVNSFDAMADATVIINEFGQIQKANKAVRNMKSEHILGLNCHDLLHPASININSCLVCNAIANKTPMQGFEFEDTGTNRWYEASVSGINSSDEYTAMVHTLREITFRKRTELKFTGLNRLYRVLSHTNQAIARTQDRNLLLQRVCDIAVDYGGFKMAWIGHIKGFIIHPDYYAGEESGYLSEMEMRSDDSEWAKGPVGVAVKMKKVTCVNNARTDPSFAPWRIAAINRGYASLAAVPLKLNKEVIAVFTLYSTQEGAFDSEMLSLLSNLSDDIGAALFHIDQAQLKLQAEYTVRKLSSALEQSADAVIITDTRWFIEYVNQKFIELSGYSEKEILGKNISVLKADTDTDNDNDKRTHNSPDLLWKNLSSGIPWRGETLSRKKDGEIFWSMGSVSPIKNNEDKITHFVSTSVDNSKLHQAQETIQKLAFYDPLTKLANRRLLMDRLENNILSANRNNEWVAVLLCDLDNFKNVNDSLGHDYGDLLLQHVSEVLQNNVRADDTVARLGGDEFTLVIGGIKSAESVINIANKILTELEAPIQLSGNQIAISSSIGIAVYPQDGEDSKELLRNADLAMYYAKDNGKNRFQFYQQKMNEKAQARLSLENKLRGAIENEKFELYYQPQVNLLNGKIVGVEALIRWRDDELGIIPPDQFIPLAEESGLIGIVGDWVIKQAYHDWQTLYDTGFCKMRMAVNVAAYQFRNAGQLCETIRNSIKSHPDCPANMFTVELTEGTLIENIESTVSTLNALKDLGIGLSIDDFGTGYSSLNYLKNFPIDQLKIDKTFVQDVLIDSNVEAITNAIIVMAQKLDLKIIAEGIEKQGQCDFLLENGCEFAQGFLYYKAMPINELIKISKNNFCMK
jgi:diguanylate cyclase (GGDEF)-like protein/PAS domain S-box-containing protein